MFERIQKINNQKISFDKAPAQYDNYICSLSHKYLEIAERELGETEETRNKGLCEMREWIANNPLILRCRTDALFLLRFLRVCKFKVPAACKKLENYLYIHEKYPKSFENISLDDEKIRGLFEAEYLTVLPEKDNKGRQIWLFQTHNLDPKKFRSSDLLRMTELIVQLLYQDEEVQVTGVMGVFDDHAFNMGHVLMWNFQGVRDAVRYMSYAMPLRICGWQRVAFPTVGRVLLEFVRSLMAKKIQNRVNLFKTMDDVEAIMNLDILPKEYNKNGKYTCKELIAEFLKVAEARKLEVLDQAQVSFDLENFNKKDAEKNRKKIEKSREANDIMADVNSNFRQLTVD